MPSPEQERIATLLGRHYAADRLDAAELDRRLDLTFGGSLDEALDGLPPLSAAAPKRRRWARRHAVDRLVANAKLLGATGILAMRFDSSEMGNGLTEVVAYGTAVVVERAEP